MPQVKSFTPAWLSQPSPGYNLFTQAGNGKDVPSLSQGGNTKKAKIGPLRTIAHRGAQVFIAVGKEIRWADLVYLKEAWEDREKKKREASRKGKSVALANQLEGGNAQGYRTIKTPVADDIRQLVMSPNGTFLAILTTHTVHIAVLPNTSNLTAADTSPMKIKTFQLGPTTHVTTRSAVASALWHPLGVNGACLVTVTEDAVVRVWELNTSDRRSFDMPAFSIDLKKLADGTSQDQDFEASVSGINPGFSPDSFDMEVAAASFPARETGGWSPMTLWIAMTEGDMYALCPLLPSKWSPPPTLVPSLSVSIVAKNAAIEDDVEVSTREKLLAQQQLQWMADIDNQEPSYAAAEFGEPSEEVYTRPSRLGHVPKLQGPFDFDLAPETTEENDYEHDSLLADIYVIGAKIDGEELMGGEDDNTDLDVGEDGLSVGVVCLLARSGQVSVLLDLDGVEAQWLPKSKSRTSRFSRTSVPPSLLTFDILDTTHRGKSSEDNWPVFSQDPESDYTFYVTDASNITCISLEWFSRLESELKGNHQGADFRIDLLVRGNKSTRQRLLSDNSINMQSALASSNVMMDADLGYFLLSSHANGPVALSMESPGAENSPARRSRSFSIESDTEKAEILSEPRQVYQPASIFNESSALPRFLEKIKHDKHKRLLKEQVRLSPATLTIMTEAHTILSEETHRLGSAAAELFRRCERLQIELKDQIKKVNEIGQRIEHVTGDDMEVDPEDDEPLVSHDENYKRRIAIALEKQSEITQRVEKLRKRVARGKTRDLSEKEKAWFDEVSTIESKLMPTYADVVAKSSVQEPWQRYEEIEILKNELSEQASELAEEGEQETKSGVQVPSEIRKAKIAQVTALLDRETALVEGAKLRLERLTLC
ncbi:hypothetical protein BJ878DRAFT_255751 [Calycina marina]|uniref:Nucleoporin NUP82 n=1 Tax=Calycina marina TaxID=1763456 RepID=A0A9P7Z7P4_9HELO|nr:hypothetical protein BJ878DRAFT_255751 [Calycina marina]